MRVVFILFTFLTSTHVNAALLSRLGGLAYYDDVANLTWLADANYAKTSLYQREHNGLMNWGNSTRWVSNLNIGGITGWRLPGSTTDSCSIYNCRDLELYNMFYNVLGGSFGNKLSTNHNSNYDLFSNIQDYKHWTNERFDNYAYYFSAFDGSQDRQDLGEIHYAWAVRDGDVLIVPEPTNLTLLIIGLAGLFFSRKKQKHNS